MPVLLQSDPEVGAHPEYLRESKRGGWRDGPLAVDDFVQARERNAVSYGKRRLQDAQRIELGGAPKAVAPPVWLRKPSSGQRRLTRTYTEARFWRVGSAALEVSFGWLELHRSLDSGGLASLLFGSAYERIP